MQIAYSLIAVFIVSLISFSGILFLPLKESALRKIIFVLVALSVGAMFWDAFIHLLPEAFASTSGANVSTAVLFGIVLFFIMEKYLSWKHTHGINEETEETEKSHNHSTNTSLGVLVNFADGIHNCIDGIIIGGAFFVSTELGIATTIAVVLHEIPQEVANFGVLIHAGYTKTRALFYNFISALMAFLGVYFAFVLDIAKITPMLLAFAAGSFIYIAGSDFIPDLKRSRSKITDFIQIISMIAGIVMMVILGFIE